MTKYLIDPKLKQFKGQLHIHTTNSDGRLTQQQSFEKYKAAGYNFLAFTEHNRMTPSEMRDGVLILSGIEIDRTYIDPGHHTAYHILGIGADTKKYVPAPSPALPQELIDSLKAAGAFVVVAHPSWSIMTAEDIAALKDYDAIEIMNWISQQYNLRGDSSHHIDRLMSRGKPSLIVATDDVHYYDLDFAGTFTMAVCDDLNEKSVLNALKTGSMYASCGPVIHSLYIKDAKLQVECSPARAIYFISDAFYTSSELKRLHFDPNGKLEAAQYTPEPMDSYIRVVIEDDQGRMGWSQYVSVQDIK